MTTQTEPKSVSRRLSTGISRRTLLAGAAGVGVAVAAGTGAASPGFAATADHGERLKLAADGVTDYTIFVGKGENAIVQQAAHELSSYLNTITGATFPVVIDNRPPTMNHLLVVGKANSMIGRVGSTIDYDSLTDDGFAYRTQGQNLFITGATTRGTLYGVYWLLDRVLGVRWFSASHTVVPSTPELQLPVSRLGTDHVPHFQWREILAGDANDPAYRQHLMLNGRARTYLDVTTPAGINTWSEYWPETQRDFRQVVTTPGLQQAGQLKMMDPATRTEAAAGLTSIINQHVTNGGSPCVAFDQSDSGLTWDADADSWAFAKAHGDTLAAPVMDMINDVATRVGTNIPGAWLETEAYQFTFNPPTGMRIVDNVVVTVAPIHADFGHSLFGPKNTETGAVITSWCGLAKNVVLWDYLTNYANYLMPFPDWKAMCQSVKALAKTPVRGYFGEGAYNTAGAELANLRLWVLSRLLWDPELDPDALIAEFVNGYYGAAGKQVSAYLALLLASFESSGIPLSLSMQTTDVAWLAFDTVREADRLLSIAESSIGNDAVALQHVRELRVGIDYTILMRQDAFEKAAAAEGVSWNPDIAARSARFIAALKSSGLTAYSEAGGDVERLIALLTMQPVPASVPAAAAGLPASSWIDFQQLALTLYPPVTTFVEDDKASDHYSVKMPGNSSDWGVQLPLQLLPNDGSTWKLYATAKVDTGTAAATSTALTLGVYPPFGNEIDPPVSAFADGGYHEITLPGTYSHDTTHTAYVAPPNSASIPAVYIDRMFAIKV